MALLAKCRSGQSELLLRCFSNGTACASIVGTLFADDDESGFGRSAESISSLSALAGDIELLAKSAGIALAASEFRRGGNGSLGADVESNRVRVLPPLRSPRGALPPLLPRDDKEVSTAYQDPLLPFIVAWS